MVKPAAGVLVDGAPHRDGNRADGRPCPAMVGSPCPWFTVLRWSDGGYRMGREFQRSITATRRSDVPAASTMPTLGSGLDPVSDGLPVARLVRGCSVCQGAPLRCTARHGNDGVRARLAGALLRTGRVERPDVARAPLLCSQRHGEARCTLVPFGHVDGRQRTARVPEAQSIPAREQSARAPHWSSADGRPQVRASGQSSRAGVVEGGRPRRQSDLLCSRGRARYRHVCSDFSCRVFYTEVEPAVKGFFHGIILPAAPGSVTLAHLCPTTAGRPVGRGRVSILGDVVSVAGLVRRIV